MTRSAARRFYVEASQSDASNEAKSCEREEQAAFTSIVVIQTCDTKRASRYHHDWTCRRTLWDVRGTRCKCGDGWGRGHSFHRPWLTAADDVLRARDGRLIGDMSDADAAVLEKQAPA